MGTLDAMTTTSDAPGDDICPRGHGRLVTTKEWCHDFDPECGCETIDACRTCGYQHFRTCVNAVPDEFGEPHEGDTWICPPRPLRRYVGTGWESITDGDINAG